MHGRHPLVLSLIVVLTGSWPLRADPADDLLRLAPPDAAVTFVVRDLKTHAKAVAGSPFARWLAESPIGRQLADPQARQKLAAVEKLLAEQIGLTAEQLLADVFGDALVLAYQPGPAGKPEQESGVILVRARNPESLAKLVEAVNRLQRGSGELAAVRDRAYRDRTYLEREKAVGGREYVYHRDGVLAFSGQEAAIRAVIDREQASDRQSAVADGIGRLGLADKLAVCWFAPRRFDADLRAKAEAAADPGERAFLTEFQKVWAATDGVAVYAHPDRGLELGLAVAADPGKLPPAVRDVLFPARVNPGLWGAVPADAMIAFGGRVNVPKLLAVVETFLPAEGKAGLRAAVADGLGPLVGKGKLAAVLAGVGPGWVAWASPPAGKDVWIPHWAVAVELAEPARVPVLQMLDFATQLLRLDYNRKHADQIELLGPADGGSVRTLANEVAFPTGFRPSFGLNGGRLVIADSPETVSRFGQPTPPVVDQPLLSVSATRLRRYLADNSAEVTVAMARWTGKPKEQVAAEVFAFGASLSALDRLELRHSAADGRLKLWLRAEFVQPLK
ncbi:MAG: hypothetical protein U0871_11800 [Gemmataceae bacterium]